MAAANPNESWPPPRFDFSVTLFDGVAAPFQQVDGLDAGSNATAYRRDGNPVFSSVKLPAVDKLGNVTLRRGVFVNDVRFWNWCSQIRMGTIARGTVIIALLDEAAVPRMTWTLTNAWPTRITVAELKPEGNEVAVESLEIAYETLATGAA